MIKRITNYNKEREHDCCLISLVRSSTKQVGSTYSGKAFASKEILDP